MFQASGSSYTGPARVFSQVQEAGGAGVDPVSDLTRLLQKADDHPQDMSIRTDLARAYMEEGQNAKAIPLLREICKTTPKRPGPWSLLVEALTAAGRYEQSLDTVDRALRHFPGDFRLSYQKSGLFEHLEWPSDALQTLRPFALSTELPVHEMMKLAQALHRLGALSEAQNVLKRLMSRAPDHSGAWNMVLEIALERDISGDAITLAEDVLAHKPRQTRLRRNALRILRRAGQSENALAHLSQCYEGHPDDLMISQDYAAALLGAGQGRAAEAVYANILRLDPENHRARLSVVVAAERAGELDAAQRLLEDPSGSEETDDPKIRLPRDARSLVRYARLAFRRDDKPRMLAVAPSLHRILPDLPDPLLLAVLRLSRQSPDHTLAEAVLTEIQNRETLERALALEVLRWGCAVGGDEPIKRLQARLSNHVPPVDRAAFEMDATLLREGPEAAFHLSRVLLPQAGNEMDALRIAEIAHDSGRGRLAIRYMRKALRRWPRSVQLTEAYLRVLTEQGETETAQHVLTAAAGILSEKFVDDARIDLLMTQGQVQGALDLCDAIQTRPGGEVNHVRKLHMEVFQGELARAMDTIKQGRLNERAHFRTTHIGAMFNELQIYQAGRPAGAEITEQEVMGFFQPARQIVHRAMAETPACRDTGYDTPLTRNLFQYWDTPEIPAGFSSVMQSWQDLPGWTYRCFNRRSAVVWLRENFGPNRARAFRLASNAAEESDFLRLCLLEAEGGLYVDTDDKRIDLPEKLLAGTEGAVLFREPYGAIANNVIYAPPGHPVIRFAARMAQRSMLARENDSIWSKTGPGLMTRATALYLMKRQPDSPHKLTILHQHEMLRAIHPHMKMPHKLSAKYWNAKISKLPGSVKRILEEDFV